MMTCKMIQYVLFQTFLYTHVLKKLNGIWVFGLNFALYVRVRWNVVIGISGSSRWINKYGSPLMQTQHRTSQARPHNIHTTFKTKAYHLRWNSKIERLQNKFKEFLHFVGLNNVNWSESHYFIVFIIIVTSDCVMWQHLILI